MAFLTIIILQELSLNFFVVILISTLMFKMIFVSLMTLMLFFYSYYLIFIQYIDA